jgi:integrase
METRSQSQPKRNGARTSRRGHGEGGIRQRADGRWEATIDLGYRDGRRQRKSLYGKTRAQVAKQLRDFQGDRDNGLDVLAPKRITVAAWLQHWLETVVARNTRTNTRLSYEQSVRVHILPALGRHPLSRLQPHHIDSWLAERLAAGLAPTTVRRVHAVLHIALEHAVRQGYVMRNIAGLVPPVKSDRPEVQPLSREDARRLLEAAASDRDAALYALVLAHGLRKGELLGLTWDDVDLDNRELHVRLQQQRGQLVELRRGASRRILRLRPWLVELLRAHRTRLATRRLRAGQHWRDHGLVFPSDHGTPQTQGNAHRAWKRLLARAGLDDARFHDLRHTAATLALSEGASLFDVSRMLGHGSIKTTADLYGHWTQEGREDIAVRMERVLTGL